MFLAERELADQDRQMEEAKQGCSFQRWPNINLNRLRALESNSSEFFPAQGKGIRAPKLTTPGDINFLDPILYAYRKRKIAFSRPKKFFKRIQGKAIKSKAQILGKECTETMKE